MNNQIATATALLSQAQYPIALTGAGVSTPSGIPDFRSANSGLWENANPLEVATIWAFKADPGAFYRWLHPLLHRATTAQPNPAHDALAVLERAGKLQALITQNIDDLHTRAGSANVIEVHGNMRHMTCIRCYEIQPSEPLIPAFLSTKAVPHCPLCNGVLKPNVILFGEQLPALAIKAAERAAARCDLMLIAGSSLEVAPVCDLPVLAKRKGAKVIIFNRDATELDSLADVIIRDDVAIALPQLVEGLKLKYDDPPTIHFAG